MTVNEALIQTDRYIPNRIDEREKLLWLSRVESRIIDEVHARYPELVRSEGFTGFTADDKERQLCVPMPYDELYVHFLAAKIQLRLHEQRHYNNEVFLYNSLLKDYKIMLNRRYRPDGIRRYKVR